MRIKKFSYIVLMVSILVNCICFQVSPVSAARTYYVTYPAQGDYYLVPEADLNYAIGLSGRSKATYTMFQLRKMNKTDAELFTIKRVDGDWYKIIHKASNKVLNVKNGSSYNDARLWLYPYDGTDACLFRFFKCGSSYIIQNKLGSQRIIDLDNAQCYSGSIIHLWDFHDGLSSKWRLVPAGNKTVYCRINGCGAKVTGGFWVQYRHCLKHSWNVVMSAVEFVATCFGLAAI